MERNNFKLKIKEKGTGNLLLHFLLLYFTIALSYLREYPYLSTHEFWHGIWYSGIIFHDLLNDCLDVYQDLRSPVPSTPKGN